MRFPFVVEILGPSGSGKSAVLNAGKQGPISAGFTVIHAEVYAAGELQHGPLALLDKDMPVISVAPNNQVLEKLKTNLQEVKARGGEFFLLADVNTECKSEVGINIITLPDHACGLSPIVHTVPLQLLPYHSALANTTDVDKPRKLAKSVTVE